MRHSSDRPSSCADMMSKWSAKPADYQATRLRNNQRRHRERVKHHITGLEARLAETQLQLDKALARISELTEELHLAKTLPAETIRQTELIHSGTPDDIRVARRVNPAPLTQVPCAIQELDASLADRNALPPAQKQRDDAALQPHLVTEKMPWPEKLAEPASPVLSAPSMNNTILQGFTLGHDEVADGGEQDCSDLPPPNPDESTTRCREAFTIIATHNYSGLDISAIRRHLQPGFRGSIVSGDGCRVDNRLLFALLDSIGSS
ncbi:hypothetical protein QBC33DRAFT_551609 [Phialemonium atrogriseum]|uniref:BZIP domain-containing protein n=1 Tax=Phialemonium atrogriseum TaxID=1093897 RepID=A0AAJ0FJ04_9PEZI|nr:uncharacterized protein QBC33DRAFT_551609 [Phialemonium atrogriseum]KAK1762630.1 hypothetical protein QBC33DRAFT_551609 [Phialemonium atrogriseum]